MYYSAKLNGFFLTEVHGEYMPDDSVEITKAEHAALLELQSQGKVITANEEGRPIAVDPVVAPPPAATQCTPAQGLVALFAMKKITEDDIHSAIEGISEPVEKYTAQIAFKRAVTWDRQSASIQAMADLLSLSEKDLDDLFSYAVTVQV